MVYMHTYTQTISKKGVLKLDVFATKMCKMIVSGILPHFLASYYPKNLPQTNHIQRHAKCTLSTPKVFASNAIICIFSLHRSISFMSEYLHPENDIKQSNIIVGYLNILLLSNTNESKLQALTKLHIKCPKQRPGTAQRSSTHHH